MSHSPPNPSNDPKFLPYLEINERLTELKQSHGHYYQMINLEVWALIETMDQFFPGSWNRFMTNRQLSMKQFLQRQRSQKQSPIPNQQPDPSGVDPDHPV
ncbi:hypothetical protein PCC9214_01567 [Planktothrix tepida]|uniref:Uncharacterized protein n=2 Tax=Planktothrix TaxID=54304 RepID=A0A1J1LGZ5_9CYAN|nr:MULTISPECIES: hypothetical protein [Planktothrix]CAD5935406.1 hypothetical protein PCC9214_01567 [Planktothrix tepida]CAD5976125.1 hypothetical protein NO713_04181 [Planktothrix pseudagardhii]CUR31853.1 hypothetical protein PL9214291446 [Planktothrix tepida PCC 9214]